MQGEIGAIMDRAPCGFLSFTDDGLITHVNTTLCERLGYDRAELLSRHVEILLGVGSRIFYQTHFFPLVKLHGRAEEVFMLLRSRNGDDVGVLCNAAGRERDGVRVTDCVFMEVRERRKFEDALLQARRAAESANEQLEAQAIELEMQQQLLEEQRAIADEANQAKSAFLASMSHELRTPLNAIGGYTQLLEMEVHGPVTPAQKETLERIMRSQRHLLRLINDVLDLSRIEAGRIEYAIETVRLSEVVETVKPLVDPQLASKGLVFAADVPDGLAAHADRQKVQQILINLLTNAIKFTDSGGSVSLEAGMKTADMVCVRVRDTGAGIPENMLDSIFSPFVQVRTSRSVGDSQGTGLGLTISRDFARGMRGDLTVESSPGAGSTFELMLPGAN